MQTSFSCLAPITLKYVYFNNSELFIVAQIYHSFYSCCSLPVILMRVGLSVNTNNYVTIMDHILKEFGKSITAPHCIVEPKEHSHMCLGTILSTLRYQLYQQDTSDITDESFTIFPLTPKLALQNSMKITGGISRTLGCTLDRSG